MPSSARKKKTEAESASFEDIYSTNYKDEYSNVLLDRRSSNNHGDLAASQWCVILGCPACRVRTFVLSALAAFGQRPSVSSPAGARTPVCGRAWCGGSRHWSR